MRILTIFLFAAAWSFAGSSAVSADDVGRNRASSLVSASLVLKWRIAQERIAEDAAHLAACRTSFNDCSPSDMQLSEIADGGRMLPGRARIGTINRAVNLAIRPVSDRRQFGVDDIWSSPLETLQSGIGDCEDYAILKYLALREAGLPADDLQLLIMHDPVANADHAVLAARLADRWLVLDNRNSILADLQETIQSRRYRMLAQLTPETDVPDYAAIAVVAPGVM